jgi:uncharacterized repeat protein (TIGR03803 family)
MSSRVLFIVFLFSAAACGRLGQEALPGGSTTPGLRDVLQFRTLWSFNQSDGCYPESAPITVGGKLYGTTSCGGRFGNGTIYTLSKNGRVRDFHDFEKDGNEAISQPVVVGGTLYGTTYSGGKYGYGTVYSIDATTGKDLWFYSFKGPPDGASPSGGLLYVNGTLYGTTATGGIATCSTGRNGCGTVFAISTSGVEHGIYSFQGGADSNDPTGSLTDVDGTLYGTTEGGYGTTDSGTVFSVTPYGVEKVLHAFTGSENDGQYPTGSLIFARGKLYGTTEKGGATDKGIAFSITPLGQFELVHSFGSKYGGDGWYPTGGLAKFHGRFYGATFTGGDYSCLGEDGCGVIYVLSANGDEKEIYSFQGGNGGKQPNAPLFVRGQTLYGTTGEGGSSDFGTIFSVTP